MAQQDFPYYWPLGLVSANEKLPGSAILQQRNGNDEPITLAGSMVFDADSSLWVPVSASNPLPTTLTGREVEEVVLINAVAITDTTSRRSSQITASQMRRYSSVDLLVINTHNQPINLALMPEWPGPDSNQWYQYHDGQQWQSATLQTPVSSSSRRLIGSSHPAWRDALRASPPLIAGLAIQYQAAQAPTSGSLTVIFRGVLA